MPAQVARGIGVGLISTVPSTLVLCTAIVMTGSIDLVLAKASRSGGGVLATLGIPSPPTRT